MKIFIKEKLTDKLLPAEIEPASKADMPAKKAGWNFTWRELFKTEGALFFKIVLEDSPKEVQGVMMLTIANGEMLYMNDLEVAPHNFGQKGKYDVAGCLIAFACRLSLTLGQGAYQGFLTFDSKTALIDFYRKK